VNAPLQIRDLSIAIGRPLVHGIELDLPAGSILGLAGESGSGKTLTTMAVLGILPRAAAVGGSIQYEGTELVGLRSRALNRIRGRHIGMVFQDPSSSLHPQIRVGNQLTDHVRTHLGLSRRDAWNHGIEMLERVELPHPEGAMKRYPHEFSGGQRQRIAIAIALACGPSVLLADEPTTALDVSVQAGILRLLRRLADDDSLAVLLVTHDLGVLSAVADEVAVMRAGRIVERESREHIFLSPQHEYTRELLRSLPGSALEEAPDA
jgi:peptide/nickel transport system ATP-binding protein